MCILDFLEVTNVVDLNAIDEPALTYACSHKPGPSAQGHFKMTDMCRLCRVLTLSNNPNFTQVQSLEQSQPSTYQIPSAPCGKSDIQYRAVGAVHITAPYEAIFSTPIVGAAIPKRK
jgi:hypothetical protein